MPSTILGLDIGGANLKAATPDRRAVSVPFALWKQPDRLPAALADLVAKFPDAEELAVTMTGELCDCYETRREGVYAIIKAVRFASGGRRIGVWSTDGVFVDPEEAERDYLKVASANWHASATFAGRYAPEGGGLLIDVGSTTTDIISLENGVPKTRGKADFHRLQTCELVYIGVRRTPLATISHRVCAELFATTEDVYILLGRLPERPDDRDTADGRPLTRDYSLARLARMLGGDRELLSEDEITRYADHVHRIIVGIVAQAVWEAYFERDFRPPLHRVIAGGIGEFLVAPVMDRLSHAVELKRFVSLRDDLGPEVSASAPAYAVAVLASEQS